MNNTELKNLHDFMQSAYDQSLISSSPTNYFPLAIGEFAKELASNPFLENIRKDIENMGKEAIVRLVDLRTKINDALEEITQLICFYEKIIPALSYIIEEYDNLKKRCPKNTHIFIYDLIPILKKAVSFILLERSQDHSEILKKLVKLDEKNTIIKYIFASTLSQYLQEVEIFQRDKKTSLYYSFHYLIKLHLFYDLKARPNKIQWFLDNNHHIAAAYLNCNAKNFDRVLEEKDAQEAAALGYDVEECKIHMTRSWEYIKPRLFSQKIVIEEQEDSYDGATGIFIVNNRPIEFTRHALRGQILENLFPGGKRIKERMPFDILYDAIITQENCTVWSKFYSKLWDKLSQDERAVIKKDIYNACDGINARIDEEAEIEDYLKVENTTVY